MLTRLVVVAGPTWRVMVRLACTHSTDLEGTTSPFVQLVGSSRERHEEFVSVKVMGSSLVAGASKVLVNDQLAQFSNSMEVGDKRDILQHI